MNSPSAEELQSRLDFALDAAAQAAEFIMGHYQSPDLAVDRKRDASPVTAADRGAEELIRGLISAKYPDDAVLGEEFGETDGTSGWRWVLDPVDGTKSFVHGVPLFGTLIAAEFGADQVIGLCRLPALNEVVYAARGLGAWWKIGDRDPIRAKVSDVGQLSDALFCTTTIHGWTKYGQAGLLEKFCNACGLTRGWGDCYGHVLVATGRADIMVDPALNPWDCAPLVPIMQEAGGHFVDYTGKPDIHAGRGLSVNAALLEKVLPLLGSS